MIAGKAWGSTTMVAAKSAFEMHRITVKPGGFCSKHRHAAKFNGFYVLSGELKIRVWKNDYDLVDETVLRSGDYTECRPGEYHQFEALSDVEALELYWCELKAGDIERESVGGAGG